MEKGLNNRLSGGAQFIRCREADTMREAAAALESRPAPTEERYRHKKRGTCYTLIGVGRAQGALHDEDPVVLYRGDDGGLWVRHQVEFCDGRFEKLATDTTPSRDEEGSVDREAIVRLLADAEDEIIAAVEVLKPFDYGALADAILALKTSTPERSRVLEEAARVDPELIKRVEHVAAAVGKDRHWKAASLTGHDWRRVAAALSASPIEVEK